MLGHLKRKSDLYRYEKLRKCQIGLHSDMTKGLSRGILLEAADDFRLVKDGTIVFSSEDDCAYLNDRLIYDIKTQGKNRVESFYEENKETIANSEKKMLSAMKNSRYSLFVVKKVISGYGVYLTDVFSEEELFLFDINMSHTLKPGLLSSLRIICLDGLNFSSGAGCVFDGKYLESLKNNFIDLFEKKKHVMTWDEMMCKYNPYFYKMMKRSGNEMTFSFI